MAVKRINNNRELFQAMGNANKMALDVLANKVKELWCEYIEVGFYQMYDPYVYERQYAILKALMRSEVRSIGGKKYRVDVFIDMNIMHRLHPNSQGEWTAMQVLDAIETEGFKLVNGIFREPSYAKDNTLEWLRRDVEKYIKNNLKLIGYDVD